MVTFPNAKINLGLDILRKRPDGYHDISTVMIPVPWNDVLEIVPGKADVDRLTVSGRPVSCPPESNLVFKAVKSLRKYAAFPSVDIFLHKIIPDGAGLGGGSSDAAFAIKAINELFDLQLGDEMLASIAAGIGADCPFFIYNRPMLCTGIGADMEEIRLNLPAGLTLVIVKPGVSVPTKDAYSAVTPAIPQIKLDTLITNMPMKDWLGHVKNDFEASVFPGYPDIQRIKEVLLSKGAVYASMSGSGSAVYAFFESDIMTEHIQALFPTSDILVEKLDCQ